MAEVRPHYSTRFVTSGYNGLMGHRQNHWYSWIPTGQKKREQTFRANRPLRGSSWGKTKIAYSKLPQCQGCSYGGVGRVHGRTILLYSLLWNYSGTFIEILINNGRADWDDQMRAPLLNRGKGFTCRSPGVG